MTRKRRGNRILTRNGSFLYQAALVPAEVSNHVTNIARSHLFFPWTWRPTRQTPKMHDDQHLCNGPLSWWRWRCRHTSKAPNPIYNPCLHFLACVQAPDVPCPVGFAAQLATCVACGKNLYAFVRREAMWFLMFVFDTPTMRYIDVEVEGAAQARSIEMHGPRPGNSKHSSLSILRANSADAKPFHKL